MQSSEQIKRVVKEKYGSIAAGASGCCSCGSTPEEYSVMSEDYAKVDGYEAEADLKLGCGIPTEHAGIEMGHTVLDLGAGAGNDAFVARALVGESGRVIGVDMTEEMIAKANANRVKLGYGNVEFRLGEIEDLPIESDQVDVTISNCVLNLVPSKENAFAEIFRTLKPGGHFCVSDIVAVGDIPETIKKSVDMYAGCVAGALQKDDYLNIIHSNGFANVQVKAERKIDLDDAILAQFLTHEQIKTYRESQFGIYSVTVYADKPQ